MNLLSASKRGAVLNADPFDTIIGVYWVNGGSQRFPLSNRTTFPVPAGLPDLHQFARAEARHYYLNGTPDSELEGVKFQLTGGLYDTPSGLTCYVTHPKVDYSSGGTLRPRMKESPLYRSVLVSINSHLAARARN